MALTNQLINDRRGVTVLLVSLLMISTMLVVTMVAADLVRSGLRMGIAQANSTQAYFAAEAGAELILYDQYKGSPSYDIPGTCNQVDRCLTFDASCNIIGCNAACDNANKLCHLPNGTSFKVQYKNAASPYRVNIIGYASSTQRVIQLDLE